MISSLLAFSCINTPLILVNSSLHWTLESVLPMPYNLEVVSQPVHCMDEQQLRANTGSQLRAESCTSDQSRSKTQKKYDCGILKRQRKSWDPVFALSCCSSMQFAGCDTTSRLHGIGKTLSKVQCSDEFTKISEVFMQEMPTRMISSALEKKHLSL